MKRIIAAIDAMQFSETQLDGFSYIARQTGGELTILFLEDISGYGVRLASTYAEANYTEPEQIAAEGLALRDRMKNEQLTALKAMCARSDKEIKIREATGWPSDEVIAESRFADLLLINHDTSFAMLEDTNPPQFVKDSLIKAECPVMVIPEEPLRIQELIFSYNGSASSMYAIRRFTELFPDYWDMPVQVVYADEDGKGKIPKLASLKAYLEPQYDNITYTILEGNPSSAFLSMLERRRDCLVTFGAYGRNALSRFFHRSETDSILRTLRTPLFITHP